MTGPLCAERTLLRPWRPDDRQPFVQMNADPRVMEHFPSLLSPAESDAMLQRISAHFELHGFGLWALEVPGAAFAGFVGLAVPAFEAAFTPCVEIGWRLLPEYWGFGYATEAAALACRYGFDTLGLDEIVSFTVPANVRSQNVMRRLGMTHDPRDDFDHPRIPAGDRLSRHVLYRLGARQWQRRKSR